MMGGSDETENAIEKLKELYSDSLAERMILASFELINDIALYGSVSKERRDEINKKYGVSDQDKMS